MTSSPTRPMLLTCLLLAGCPSPVEPEADKLVSMPNFRQTDCTYGELPRKGRAYCGPTAASDVLVWLDNHGFDKLLSGAYPGPAEQWQLIHTLGSPDFMKTNPRSGTGPSRIMKGIERYCRTRGYRANIRHMGWRTGYKTVGMKPSSGWMLRSCRGPSNLILNTGWYKYDAETKTYLRQGGHYFAVAGYEANDRGLWLYVHDPAGRTPLCRKCRLEALPAGTKMKPRRGDAFPADGFYSLDVTRKRSINCAIIDASIAITLEPASEEDIGTTGAR